MTLKIGYAAEHEQYSPTDLLEFTVLAEKYGFDQVWTSDHFHPPLSYRSKQWLMSCVDACCSRENAKT